MPDKKVHDCIVKAVRKLKFKPSEGGATCHLTHRLTFRPEDEL